MEKNLYHILKELCELDDEISCKGNPESEDDKNNIRRYHVLFESLPPNLPREELIDFYKETLQQIYDDAKEEVIRDTEEATEQLRKAAENLFISLGRNFIQY